MTVLLGCVAVSCFLPYLAAAAQAWAKFRTEGHYDNASPRAQTARLEGYGQRAAWAQANTWEALTLFFAAAFTARLTGADSDPAGWLGVGFVAARIAYLGAYLANLPTLRSVVWTAATLCTAGLFVLAARLS